MQPLVSVIMPAYNAEKYIGQSVESVIGQTFHNWELIVIDDGSTDKTAQTIKGYAVKDNRIKYIAQSNSGQGRARNMGIIHSSGELIAFLDSDDLWIAEKLELQIKVMDETKADLVFSDGFIFTKDQVNDEAMHFGTLTGRFVGADMLSLLFVQNRLPILSVLTKRDALNKVNLFEENARYQGSEDYDLWLKMAKYGAEFYGMPERLVRYRVHADSTSRNQIKMLKAWRAVLGKYRRDKNLNNKVKKDRYKNLYQELLSIYIEQGHVSEAFRYSKELPASDKFNFIKMLLGALLRKQALRSRVVLKRCYSSGVYRTGRIIQLVETKLRKS